MYKPPENSNRVKSIKSKFEYITNANSTFVKPPLFRSKTTLNLFVNETSKNDDLILNAKQDTSSSLVKDSSSVNNNCNSSARTEITRQLSDPSKRNIKRTPAFRLDRNIIDQKTTLLNLKSNLKDLSHRSNGFNINYKERLSRTKINGCGQNNFSDIRNKFNGDHLVSNMHQVDVTKNETENNILKLLYAEAIPKSKRINNNNQNHNIHNVSTLKVCDKQLQHLSDDESCHAKTNFVKNNLVYGSLRSRKSLENLLDTSKNDLTDTLKSALKKPLPQGPAPKKPPRTFTHTPEKETNINKEFSDRLNKDLQKSLTKKTHTGDAKYMLDKLETALKNKGKLLRKAVSSINNTTATSEEDSDNEKNKFKYRILPNLPESHTIYYSTPPIENTSKFNFNCLSGSLGCVSSAYEPVKEPSSCFFIDCKTEEPVYAEPFQFQVEVKRRVKTKDIDSGKDEPEGGVDIPTIRRSVHYASSPVPDLMAGDTNGQVSDMKHIDQQILADMERNSSSLSTPSSDMDSVASSQTETFISYIKVKERVQAIESADSDKQVLHNNNFNTSATLSNETGMIHDSRLKNLAIQLKDTLDQSFSISDELSSNSDISKSDEKNENKLQTSKFVTYVNKVRNRLRYQYRKKKENLFHCCLLVSLNRNAPYIKSKYPPNVEIPYKIEDLCFPEVECGPMDYSVKAQCYSLIITNEQGERTFGYCRRVLPEGSTACLPLVYCILSKQRAPGFYRRILEELESCHGYPDKFRDSLLEELYNCKFPMPGETIAINCSKIINSSVCQKPQEKESPTINSTNIDNCDSNNRLSGSFKKFESSLDNEDPDLKSFVVVCNNGEYGSLIRKNIDSRPAVNGVRGTSALLPSDTLNSEGHRLLKRSNSSPSLPTDFEALPAELIFMRPRDSRHEENALTLLGETLKVPVLQKIFCSLLLERKVIFVSCVLSKLSSCIEAIQIILYPFSWQHTIIPVLPRSLWEIVEAPTPLVCGVLSAEVVNDFNIEDAIIVDLDEGNVLVQVGDEDKILPASLIRTLKDGINLAKKVTSIQNDGAHNIFLSDAFLRVFIQSCGHYKNFILNGEFKRVPFIEQSKHRGKHIRQFLKWFTETTMFYNFKELAESESNNLDLFDQRIKIYSSHSVTEILNKMKDWSHYRTTLTSNLHRFQ